MNKYMHSRYGSNLFTPPQLKSFELELFSKLATEDILLNVTRLLGSVVGALQSANLVGTESASIIRGEI